MPSLQQERQIQDTFSSCVYLYNFFLSNQLERLARGDEPLDYYACAVSLMTMQEQNAWLRKLDPAALCGAVRESAQDFWRYERLRRIGLEHEAPRLRKHADARHRYVCSDGPGAVVLGDGVVQVPYLGDVDCTVSRLPMPVRAAAVVQGPDTYYQLAVRCACADAEDSPYHVSIRYFDPVEYGDRLRTERARRLLSSRNTSE